MTRARRVLTAGAVLGLGLLAGCGSSETSSQATSTAATQATTTSGDSPSATSPETGASTAKLATDPTGQLRYSTTSLTAKAGTVNIDFTNDSPLPHNVTVATSQGKVLGASPTFRGGTFVLTLNLQPGTYTFYCSVPGHRDAGMQGTLVVIRGGIGVGHRHRLRRTTRRHPNRGPRQHGRAGRRSHQDQ